ncbi:RNA-binding motif protein, X chromosome isoform X2 [Patella vulgata]|uniref:RNA-binding motif protein, X chromosome isoform X2 n=1 Tax=Patella vulgata TaxID=6465 RepID=UPI00218095F5|nr:RNA-binding motif protein, X chromosome isoform X2 [Patella vulgata]
MPDMLEKDRPGKLFIGGLSIDITEDRLEKVFGKYGRIIEVLVIKDKIHQQSRGFGFVTYENPQDAIDACKGLNDTEINGSTIHVTEAVKKVNSEMSGSPRRGGFSSRGRGGPPMGARRGGSSGGYTSSRGRGAPVSRGRDESFDRRDTYDRSPRERSPLRRSPLLSRGPPPSRDFGGYSGSRDDGPPPRRQSDFNSRAAPAYERRDDRYSSQSSYPDRGGYLPPKRDDYRSEPRAGLLDDRLPPSRSYGRDPPVNSRANPPSSRDYSVRDYSPERSMTRAPVRGYQERNDYGPYRPERKDSFERSSGRDYSSRGDYVSRDMGRDPPPRDTYSSRESYPSRDPLPPRRDYGDSREYSSGRSGGGFSSRDDIHVGRGPPPRETSYRDSGPSRSYGMSSKGPLSSSRAPPPSDRGPAFSSRGPPPNDRRGDDRNGFSASSRRGPSPKRSRMDDRPPSRGRPPMRR